MVCIRANFILVLNFYLMYKTLNSSWYLYNSFSRILLVHIVNKMFVWHLLYFFVSGYLMFVNSGASSSWGLRIVKCNWLQFCFFNLAPDCVLRTPALTSVTSSWEKSYWLWKSIQLLAVWYQSIIGCRQSMLYSSQHWRS